MASDIEYRKRERFTLDLHHSLNPLVEGVDSGAACTKISGVDNETLSRVIGKQTLITQFHRPSFSDTKTAVSKLSWPAVTIDSTIQRNGFSPTTIFSVIKDQGNNVLEYRRSEIRLPLWSRSNTIDTSIYQPDGLGLKLKVTIHSEQKAFPLVSDHFDTVVRDAAGETLRRLSSDYEQNTFSPDSLCTRVEPQVR